MLKKLTGVSNGQDVWINPAFVVSVGPANETGTAIYLSNGQNFILEESPRDIVDMLTLDESDDWKRGMEDD